MIIHLVIILITNLYFQSFYLYVDYLLFLLLKKQYYTKLSDEALLV